MFEMVAEFDPEASEAALVERIAAMERVKSVAAADQAKATAANGLGLCEACNYTKEAPGWTVSTSTDEHGTHTAQFTTPTGARHRSSAPPLLGDIPTITPSGVEVQVGIEFARHAA